MTEERSRKEQLLSRLLEGVKGCQSRFGSRTELATEDELSVRKLCLAFEDVFLHGVRGQPQEKSKGLWQMTESLVPAGLRLNTDPTSSSFWPLIKCQLSKHEAERFLLLHNVRSDFGRSRAWLRAALNEHSLERYILILLSLDDLQNYYENWAFFRDPELSAILPQTAAGLGSVLFALVVDNPVLDSSARDMDKAEPQVASPVEVGEVADQFLSATAAMNQVLSDQRVPYSTSKDEKKSHHSITNHSNKKKKKKAPINVVSFDDEDLQDLKNSQQQQSSSPILNPSSNTKDGPILSTLENNGSKPLTQRTNMDEVTENRGLVDTSATMPVQIIGNRASSSSISISNSRDHERSPASAVPPEISIYSSSVKSIDCISINSVYSDCSERLDLDNLSLTGMEISPSQRLKPMRGGSIGGNGTNFNGSGGDNYDPDSSSQDLIPVPSFDSSKAPELELELNLDLEELGILSPATPSCTSEPSTTGTMSNQNVSRNRNLDLSTHSSMSNSDERIQKLKSILDREVETVATLQSQFAEEKRKSTDQIKIYEAKVETLMKENEILKHQLKKYIGAVQMLKKEGVSRRTSSFEEEDEVLMSANRDNEDSAPDEAAEYERKLIQVAEMHGELMEFNAHLQKSLRKRDTLIRRLREELIDLRGPLAAPLITGDEDGCFEDYDETWDIVDSSSNNSNDSRSRSNTVRRIAAGLGNERVLINIWIPSAFLTGAANDLHHVYQVFLRIKDTEWNVYRRYSQFYGLHRDLKKRETVVGSFYFPPKKHLGNKDAKFVDERRRKLQEYLRKVINHTLQTNSILAAHPDKNLLISIFPFFGESVFPHNSQKPKRERSRSRNLFFLPSSSSSSSNQAQTQAQHPSGFQSSVNSAQYPQYTGL